MDKINRLSNQIVILKTHTTKSHIDSNIKFDIELIDHHINIFVVGSSTDNIDKLFFSIVNKIINRTLPINNIIINEFSEAIFLWFDYKKQMNLNVDDFAGMFDKLKL